MKKFKCHILGIVLVLTLLLGACKQETPIPTPVVVSDHTPPAVSVSETDETTPDQTTAEPVEDPGSVSLEQVQAQIVLWAPGSADANLAQNFAGQLQNYAQQNALSFEQRENLSPSQLSVQTQLVVALASQAELKTMAEANGQVQFLYIGNLEESPLPNVHVLNQVQALPEQQSFLAGLAAVLGAPEFRVGSITMSNTATGQIARDGFLTGARYYCGLCRSRYTPLILYPIQAELEDPVNWQGALDHLLSQEVKTVFVQPEASSPELISALNAKGITIIAVEGQSGLDLAENVLGVLSSGLVADISPIVERILAHEPLGVIKIGLELTRIDESKLGAGKQILFERYKEDLLNGDIKALPYGQ